MNVSKDIYEHIANFADDDRTILSILSLHKNYKDEKLFRRITERRYPLLIEFKKPEETWQKFFVKMTYYINKLKEKPYFIPYIPIKGYDPRELLKYNIKDIYNQAMYIAAQGGRKDLVELFIQKGANNWNKGAISAAKGGHDDLYDFIIQKGNDDWDKIWHIKN